MSLDMFELFSDDLFWSGNHAIAFCLMVCVVATKNILYC